MENEPSKKLEELLNKMTAEEIEEFGKWYVQHLKEQKKKEEIAAKDKERSAHPQGSADDRLREAEMIKRLGL